MAKFGIALGSGPRGLDISCISIPWDNMDPEFLKCPRKWDSSSIGKFMIWMGPVKMCIRDRVIRGMMI